MKEFEKILEQINALNEPFSKFEFFEKDGQFQLIGKGGFSVVYDMASKKNPNEHYAMKIIEIGRDFEALKRSKETFKIQKILSKNSRYIMKLFEEKTLLVRLDEDGNVKYVQEVKEKIAAEDGMILQFILMEKLEHIVIKNPYKKIKLVERLCNEKEVLKFAIHIGQAIKTAHENKVLHRDIKLENIFWDERTECYKLGDFGIAKLIENGNADTIVYTDGYGAPEIKKRLKDSYDATVDIYSFGISLYLLLNKLRFPGSEGYYVNRIQYEPLFIFPAPEKASEVMTRMIRKMCSYYKEERYQTMAEVLETLKDIMDGKQDDQTERYVVLSDLPSEIYIQDTMN